MHNFKSVIVPGWCVSAKSRLNITTRRHGISFKDTEPACLRREEQDRHYRWKLLRDAGYRPQAAVDTVLDTE